MDDSQLGVAGLPRLLAVEVLLAEPEKLGDDVLETCLYILRDRLRGTDGSGTRIHLDRAAFPRKRGAGGD